MSMAKKGLRYLKSAKDLKITYSRGNGKLKLEFESYSDSNWGSSTIRHSTSGYVFLINKSPISWASKKQQTVAVSSTEAEYVATTLAAKKAIYLRRLLVDLGHPQEGATIMKEDNQSCITLAKNPVYHQRAKHIDI